MSKNIQILKFILVVYLGWKIILTLISFFGLSFLPVMLPDNSLGWEKPGYDFWLKWANWDGGHFKGIAENGYLHSFQVVFFPLYPLLVRLLMLSGISSLVAGLLISNLSLLGGLYYLYKLVCLDFEEKTARKTVILTLAFPTAFYFSAFYSESLFLFLSVAAIYYARIKQWRIALLFASFSAVTRFTGLIIILMIGLEYFLKIHHPPSIKQLWSEFTNKIAIYLLFLAFLSTLFHDLLVRNNLFLQAGLSRSLSVFLTIMAFILFAIFIAKFLYQEFAYKKVFNFISLFFVLSLIPFFGYCVFLYSTQDNFLAFVAHEQQWARHLTLPWNAPLNYIKDLINFGYYSPTYTAQRLIELIFFIFFIILSLIGYFKLRLSYFIYVVLSLLIPTTTGTLQAIHRYGLVVFPIFILLALIKDEVYKYSWLFFSLSLLGLLTVLFINHYWVS